MTSFFIAEGEEECVISYYGRGVKAESPVCDIYSTSGEVIASVQVKTRVKVAAKKSSWRLRYSELRSLTESLCSPLRLSGVDSIIT